MESAELRELYQTVILDHYKKPRNVGRPAGADREAEGRNPLAKDNDVFSPGAAAARLFAMQQYRDFLAREGDPADAILDVAEEEGADLIVVGNKGMTGAKRFLLGSVPNKVSHHAPCSVIIIRTT